MDHFDAWENEFDNGVAVDMSAGIESVWLRIIWCVILIIGLAFWTIVGIFAWRAMTWLS